MSQSRGVPGELEILKLERREEKLLAVLEGEDKQAGPERPSLEAAVATRHVIVRYTREVIVQSWPREPPACISRKLTLR